ncbi:protein of unknown function [Pustulibacterium marinum]|uniref:SusE outer membrane protein domain-containing protein n=1 Tax=Pustulibacterium marinum TaxID=1224947 RepID=A0A1I7H6U7_9FLAO|nr:SusF/SusE family outer membrane protein [Pustulibacterium marinum]SFU56379.1 protein of unknown function [Pustulibacterium marinum]
MKNIKFFHFQMVFLISLLGITIGSCDDHFEDQTLAQQDKLTLSISQDTLSLVESLFTNEISFNWTTGTNEQSGKAIQYTLALDHFDGDFSNPIVILADDLQQTYNYSITYGDLNQILLERGYESDISYALKARIMAFIGNSEVSDQYAEVTFEVSLFKPITQNLFMVGDATPNGWDIANAIEMQSQSGQRGVYLYQGPLSIGNFKFAVSRETCWCQDFYTRNEMDPDLMVYNEGGSGQDLQWSITDLAPQGEEYLVKVDLLTLTIDISIVAQNIDEPPFSLLWIVGDASESGWNIDTPIAMEQSTDDPFIFSYEGHLSTGNFKIFAGPLGDWCGEWYRPEMDNMELTNGLVLQNSGCTSDTNWLITSATEGRYKITLNTEDNTIAFEQVMVYIIGDGGANGWDIATPSPMNYQNGEYVFSAALGANNATGEFKFSKFTGDWCDGDWINAATDAQPISNTNFIITHGCDGPDNKWKLQNGEAGNYEIRINLDSETMMITQI